MRDKDDKLIWEAHRQLELIPRETVIYTVMHNDTHDDWIFTVQEDWWDRGEHQDSLGHAIWDQVPYTDRDDAFMDDNTWVAWKTKNGMKPFLILVSGFGDALERTEEDNILEEWYEFPGKPDWVLRVDKPGHHPWSDRFELGVHDGEIMFPYPATVERVLVDAEKLFNPITQSKQSIKDI